MHIYPISILSFIEIGKTFIVMFVISFTLMFGKVVVLVRLLRVIPRKQFYYYTYLP